LREPQLTSIPKAAQWLESLIWTERGKLRLTAALALLLAAHLLTTMVVVQLINGARQ
jgi:hypothetical protein